MFAGSVRPLTVKIQNPQVPSLTLQSSDSRALTLTEPLADRI